MPARQGQHEDRPTGNTCREGLEKTAEARRALLKKVGVEIRIGVVDGKLLVHPVALGDRLPLPEGAVDKNRSPEEIRRREEKVTAERRRWGVPDTLADTTARCSCTTTPRHFSSATRSSARISKMSYTRCCGTAEHRTLGIVFGEIGNAQSSSGCTTQVGAEHE